MSDKIEPPIQIGDTITCEVHLKERQYLVTGTFALGYVVKDLSPDGAEEMHLPYNWQYQIIKRG